MFRDEEAGKIPKAIRTQRGKISVRTWPTSQLPEIGGVYGFLTPHSTCRVISVYTPKGGVLKTTLAFNLARMLALNNIKTLVVGLDVQCSITNNLSIEPEAESISELPDIYGLYEVAKDGLDVKKAIRKTKLPTLCYIPESSNLIGLEQLIRDQVKREYLLDRLLNPLKKDFDVIIFDNGPNWNFLTQNSLVAATDLVSPIACDVETFRSLQQNLETIGDFKSSMSIHWNSLTLIPTKLERTKLSTQIEASYRTSFPEEITAGSIRVAVKGQEASLDKVSIIEYDPSSTLAEDYYGVVQDIWSRVARIKIETEQKEELLETM